MKRFILLTLFLFACSVAFAADQTLTENEAQGIDITSSGSGGTTTVSGINATDTQKGVAKFNVANFAVATGDVTIKDGGVDLIAEVTGTLPIANGGTGTTSLTDGGILLGNGATDIQAMAVLADGSIVVGDGTTDPVALAVFTNSTGDVKHEAGGLEGDVSAYSGLVAIAGGAVAEVDSKSELEAQIAGVDNFAEADGDIYTGVHDFGGVTDFEIENGTNPTVDTAGEISNDTNDNSIRAFDGTNQYVAGQKKVTITATIIEPDKLDEASTLPIWQNRTNFTFNITAIYSVSANDNTIYTLLEVNDPHDFTGVTTIEAITIATDGTSVFYDDRTTGIDHTVIEKDHIIIFDASADTPDYINFTIVGYFDANVS